MSYFPAGLDAAVNKKFGAHINCVTTYNIFSMTHVTTWDCGNDKVLDEKIKLYIEAFKAGVQELTERLTNVNNPKPEPQPVG